MRRTALFEPKSSVVLPGDLVLKCLLGNQANLQTLGLGLFFFGWPGRMVMCSGGGGRVCVLFLSGAWVMGRLRW